MFAAGLANVGFQAVAMPRAQLLPPDLYLYSKRQLFRLGQLTRVLSRAHPFNIQPAASAPAVACFGTKTKSAMATAVTELLTLVGAGGTVDAGGLAKSFDSHDLFLDGCEIQAVEPLEIIEAVRYLKLTEALNVELSKGNLHVAYEYLSARNLRCISSSGIAISAETRLAAEQIFGGAGSVSAARHNEFTISLAGDKPIIVGYRSGLLVLQDSGDVTFHPSVLKRVVLGEDVGVEAPYLVEDGVLLAQDSDPTLLLG